MHRCNCLVQHVYMHIYGRMPTEGPVRTDSVAFVTGANRGFRLTFVHSRLTKGQEKTMAPNEPLRYDGVFSDPIPQNVTGPLPTGERHRFSALATTLI